MKTAIYVEDGRSQVVLTPENDFDKVALKAIQGPVTCKIVSGTFYACQGGFTKLRDDGPNSSIIIVMESLPDPGKQPPAFPQGHPFYQPQHIEGTPA